VDPAYKDCGMHLLPHACRCQIVKASDVTRIALVSGAAGDTLHRFSDL
jgi:hypothetical protein